MFDLRGSAPGAAPRHQRRLAHSDGKCCDECNATVVVPARIELEKSAMRQLEGQIAKG